MQKFKVAFAAMLVLLVSSVSFAAEKASLTVNVSNGPAQVFLSGKLVGIAKPRLAVLYPMGTYELSVTKLGMPEYRQTITLGPNGLVLDITLGGGPVQSAPQPAPPPPPVVKPKFSLNIQANAPGAQVQVNGTALGQAPARATIEAGTYDITVTAPGYESYSARVQVNGDTTHQATLRALYSTINVNIPPQYLSKSAPAERTADRLGDRGRDKGRPEVKVETRPESKVDTKVEFWLDGVKQAGFSVQVQPGRHDVLLVIGGLSVSSSVSVDPGRTYTVEPTLSLNIR